MMCNNLIYFLAFALLVGEVFSEYNLTVVHIGDFHSHWFEFNEKEVKCSNHESIAGKCFGGFPRLLNMVRDLRKQEKNVIVLSSGEFFLGRSLNPLHRWKIADALVPKLELDAMSLANPDFGSGMLELSAFLYAMNVPVVCTNMEPRQTSYFYNRVNKSAIIDVKGERIGVLGYVHPDTLQKSKTVTSVKFTPEIPAIQEEVANLELKGINKIIALGHSGYHTDLEIAKSVMGVDVVIGGNSDIVMEKPRDENLQNYKSELLPTANKTLLINIPPHGNFTILRFTFDDNGNIIKEASGPHRLGSWKEEEDESEPDTKNKITVLLFNLLDKLNLKQLFADVCVEKLKEVLLLIGLGFVLGYAFKGFMMPRSNHRNEEEMNALQFETLNFTQWVEQRDNIQSNINEFASRLNKEMTKYFMPPIQHHQFRNPQDVSATLEIREQRKLLAAIGEVINKMIRRTSEYVRLHHQNIN